MRTVADRSSSPTRCADGNVEVLDGLGLTELRRLHRDLERRRERLRAELDAVDAQRDRVAAQITRTPQRGRGVRIPIEQARDVAVELQRFTIPQFAEALHVCYATAQAMAERLVEMNIIAEDGVFKTEGPGRPASMFAYVPPPNTAPRARRTVGREPIPAAEQLRSAVPMTTRGRPAAPTGRRPRIANEQIAALVRCAEEQGWCVSLTDGGSLRLIHQDGERGPLYLPRNPGDHRAILNCRARMREYGIAC